MKKNLIGERYGYLEVVRPDRRIQSTATNKWITYWFCKCHKCGEEESVQQSLLTGKVVRACTNCQRSLPKPLTSNKGIKKTRMKDVCNINRGTLTGFSAYFEAFPRMFESTFQRPCTPENIKNEFEKLKIEA